jgi:CheY-like chemotaxis protein
MYAVRAFRSVEILMVEDNPGDVRLTREALRQSDLDLRLHHVEDGVAAMHFLQRRPPHESAPRPDIVLLDLNLPLMDGRAVLAAMKSDPALRAIPVIVLTTSHAEVDVERAYDLQASCFVIKPADLHEFNRVVQSIEHFWFKTVRLRTREQAA